MTVRIQAKGSHSYRVEEISIDSTGEKIVFDIIGDALTSINIEGEEEAEYSIDVGPTKQVKFKDEETYTGESIQDAFRITDRYLAVRVTEAASTTDAMAEITLQVTK